MTAPRTISPELARAQIASLDVLLAVPSIDADTERRVRWLRMRLVEIADIPSGEYDLIEARIAALCPQEGARRERLRDERTRYVAA